MFSCFSSLLEGEGIFIIFLFTVVFFFFVYCLQDEKKVHIVAMGYGRKSRPVNTQVLQEIGGDNVLVMQRDRFSGYTSYAKQIKDMVCGKFNISWCCHSTGKKHIDRV